MLSKKLLNICLQKKNSVLDFGCGSGDFIALLLHYYKSVFAFDPSEIVIKKAKETYHQQNLSISNTAFSNKNFDLILTVTVLQTLNKQQLQDTLRYLSQNISNTGFLVCMEFFIEPTISHHFSKDQSNYDDWQASLKENNLEIIATQYFYNPVELPSYSWQKYKNKFTLRFLKPFKNYSFAQNYFRKVAKHLILAYKDVVLDKPGTYKIFTIKKRS